MPAFGISADDVAARLHLQVKISVLGAILPKSASADAAPITDAKPTNSPFDILPVFNIVPVRK